MAWVETVRDLRKETVGRIAALSDTLGAMQRLLSDLVQVMGRIIAIQDQEGGRIGRFNTLLSEIVLTMDDWEKRLNDPSRRMLLDGIASDLSGLSRIRLFFNFLATITAIQVTREKSVELNSFVEDLKSMPERIEAELMKAQTGVGNFRKAQEEMARDAKSGATVLAQAEARLATVNTALVAAETEAGQASAQAASLAHRAMETAQAAVVRLVKAFQFSDSAAQRLEHVMTILESAQPGSAHGALAAAQLQALADDCTEIVRELDDSLGTIGTIGRSVLDGFGPSRDRMHSLLAAQSEVQGLFATVTDEARPTMERISAQCTRLDSEIVEVLSRLEALDDIGQAISLAAVNARVKAAHAALAKQELGYIAMAVNESAGQAVATIGIAVRGMGQLRQQLDALDYPGMVTRLTELSDVVDSIQTALRTASEREAEMDKLEGELGATLDQLDGVTQQGGDRLSVLPDLAAQMSETARKLQSALPGHSDIALLAGFVPIYTMAREREVHAVFTGQPVEEEKMAVDLDDILF